MGKRELLLIVAFVAVGLIVYQVTAPPLPAGQQGFSVGRVLQNVRRNIAGRQASATVSSTRIEPLEAGITELRLKVSAVDLTVTGEDRHDVSFELQVTSNGLDPADARRLATATKLVLDHAGSGLVTTIDFPRDGVQRATLAIKVPATLGLRVEPKTGRLIATNLPSLDIKGNRGETRVNHITGAASVTHRGGALAVDDMTTLRLTANGTTGTVSHVTGTATIEVTGSELTLTDLIGPLELTSRGTEVRLRGIDQLKPPLRLDMQSGSLHIDGLRTEARIDGRNTEMDLILAAAAPLTVYSTAEDILVTPPPGGYTLDAITTDGRITIEDGGLHTSGNETDQRASGSVRGGGPTISLRATRAGIRVRPRPTRAEPPR
jgi:hypothetical protein